MKLKKKRLNKSNKNKRDYSPEFIIISLENHKLRISSYNYNDFFLFYIIKKSKI